LIRRWLKAGVLEDGAVHPSEQATPQGGSISVLLSNLYLHYVLDLWFERVVKGGVGPDGQGDCSKSTQAHLYVARGNTVQPRHPAGRKSGTAHLYVARGNTVQPRHPAGRKSGTAHLRDLQSLPCERRIAGGRGAISAMPE
jgi:hypothetical protein